MMPSTSRGSRRIFLGAVFGVVLATAAACRTLPSPAPAATLNVLVSGGFSAALGNLAAVHERREHVTIAIGTGPSMGSTPQAIPARLERREPADVVILAREALDRLAASGKVDPSSVTDLARSRIAMAVRAGAPAPDIGSVEALRRTLLSARSVAYSDSASGVYLSTQLFPRLGIEREMAAKARMIAATPVGEIVARGEAEIGFQQLSELKPVRGIRIVGLIPEDVQKVTRFSAGIVTYSPHKRAAGRLIAFLASPRAWPRIRQSGMEPASSPAH
jgi:molybdate transport system substrate-binding protein